MRVKEAVRDAEGIVQRQRERLRQRLRPIETWMRDRIENRDQVGQRQRERLRQRLRPVETWMRDRIENRDQEGRVWGILGGWREDAEKGSGPAWMSPVWRSGEDVLLPCHSWRPFISGLSSWRFSSTQIGRAHV